ncbi:MAG TPA: glycosyltransferase, partial [Anaerolineales bacterium]|nr:glycosyltransferase [Anaerolineales bacterium]
NMGKGYAIKQGVLHSRGRYVLFMDGDGDISADVLAKYLQRLSKVHIVIGSKIHRRSVVHAPISRKFLSRCFQFYVKKALGLKVHDTQVGLKAGRGEVFRKIFEKVQVKRYAFDAEMLAIASLMNLKVAELPVKIDLDKPFKVKDIAKMAADVLAVAFRLKIIKWYQKNMERKRPQFRLSMLF